MVMQAISVCEMQEPCMVVELHTCPFSCLSCRRLEVSRRGRFPAGMLGAASIRGCEPLMHPACFRMLRTLNGRGVRVKLHTSGYAPEALEHAAEEGLVELAELHVRAPLDSRYGELTGREDALERLYQSLWVLSAHGLRAHLRLWLLPPLFTQRHAEEAVDAIRSMGVEVERVVVQL